MSKLAVGAGATLGWAGGAVAAQESAGIHTSKRRTVYNADGEMFYQSPQTGIEEFARAWLERETSRVPITTYVPDVALPDICLYDTQAGEMLGDRFGDPIDRDKLLPARHGHIPMFQVLRELRRQGTDSLKLILNILKPKGLEVLAGVRMADTHQTLDPRDSHCSQFALDHPEWVIRQPDERSNEAALDYSYPQVRTHRMAILREIAENYDVDGLELNFVRFAKHFPRDLGGEKAPILTEFLGEIKSMLDSAARKRGREHLVLGVRVPNGVRECWLAGVDIETWAKNRWLDYVVAATAGESDLQIPVDEFYRSTQGNCDLLVAMGNLIGGAWDGPPRITGRGLAQYREDYAGMLMTAAEARAFALNYYSWGADGVAFWNVANNMGERGKFSGPEQRERMYEWMNAAINRGELTCQPRSYSFLPLWKRSADVAPPKRTYTWYGRGQSPVGTVNTQILEFAGDELGVRKAYSFRMADGRDGGKLRGRLRFRVFHVEPSERVEIDINNRPLATSVVAQSACDEKMAGLPGTWFDISLADCPPFRGDNELGMILHTKKQRAATPYMEELYIDVVPS